MSVYMQVAKAKQNSVAIASSKIQLLPVKRGEPMLVPPGETIPTVEQYYQSNLDQNIAVIVQTVLCFKCPSGRGYEGSCTTTRSRAGRLSISPEEARVGLLRRGHAVRGG
jgi:hypothetical protein